MLKVWNSKKLAGESERAKAIPALESLWGQQSDHPSEGCETQLHQPFNEVQRQERSRGPPCPRMTFSSWKELYDKGCLFCNLFLRLWSFHQSKLCLSQKQILKTKMTGDCSCLLTFPPFHSGHCPTYWDSSNTVTSSVFSLGQQMTG